VKTCYQCDQECLELSYNSRCMDCMNKRDIANQEYIDKMEFKLPDNMFRELGDEEGQEFRDWATDNYVPGAEISNYWHPIVKEECEKINKEFTPK
jgi:hypothetical protein